MIILDASFIVKLILEEEGSEVAEKLFREWIKRGEHIITVDIALSETSNALWKHYVLLRDISLDIFQEAINDLLELWNKLSVISTHEIMREALEVAIREGITIYDSLYIAVAQYYTGALATFDTKQREKATRLGLKVLP